jgi:hypothetical protein
MSITARAQSSGRSRRRAASEYGAVSMGAVTMKKLYIDRAPRSSIRLFASEIEFRIPHTALVEEPLASSIDLPTPHT